MPKYKTSQDQDLADALKKKARDIVAQPMGDAQVRFDLAKRLSELNLIGFARQVLEKADTDNAPTELRRKVMRKLAVFTGKDQDLPLEARLQKAESMLKALLDCTPPGEIETRQDIYGSMGGLRKQRWFAYGLAEDLRQSLQYYEEGYKLGVNAGYGAYVAINTAFIRDLLGENVQPGGASPRAQDQELPESIRQKVIDVLKDNHPAENGTALYWHLCTLAEAYLGIGNTEKAKDCTLKAAEAEHHPWETETAVRQLAQLARMQARKRNIDAAALDQSSEWLAVKPLLGEAAVGAESFLRGKVGLALSGGGFRASLYHIGVLAKLAELDMLRHIEVISSVSGGSIIAAYYYLKLKKLLESTVDRDISKAQYVALVAEIERDFVGGVQENLRTRMLLAFGSNWKVLSSNRCSTTHRLADLYDSVLYRPLGGPKYMDELLIAPKGIGTNFYPQYDNWGRRAKVPILILNSTTLNTCHNWQFTARFMGEPPARTVDAEIDSNDRFRRTNYEDAPENYKKFPLAFAVAASACVPGLFAPLTLSNLYEDPDSGIVYEVELVDGGVFDNQGVSSLLEQDCSVLLVSDACGQTGMEEDPETSHFGAMSRSNNILMARVREAQYLLLTSLRDARLLRGLMYIHLKKGLAARPIDWLGCNDPSQHPDSSLKTTYGVRRDIQKALANIRTDLDSFSDAEADALMYSGYQMAGEEFSKRIAGFRNQALEEKWRFLTVAPVAGANSESTDVVRLRKTLTIAHNLAGKPWRLLLDTHQNTCVAAGLALLALLFVFVYKHRGEFAKDWLQGSPSISVWLLILLLVAAVLLVKIVEFAAAKFLHYRNSVLQVIASVLGLAFGWLILLVHLKIFDRYYLRWGAEYRAAQSGAPRSRVEVGR